MILTLGAIRQLCVVGSYLACAAARARDADGVAYAFESAAKGMEGAEEFHTGAAPPLTVERVARRQIKRIKKNCEQWLTSDLGPNWRRDPNAEAMIAALEDVLPLCLPGPEGFAEEDLDSNRIVQAALDRAAAIDAKDPTFANGGIGYSVLRSLLKGSIAALEHDREFRELLHLSGLRELLRRSRTSEEAAERRHRESDRASARRQVELLQAIGRQRGVEAATLRAILTKLGEAGISDDQIPFRLNAAANELVMLRTHLARPTNDRPEFFAIRSEALSQIDRGELDAARVALKRGREAARALREDINRSEAEFLADEARIFRLESDRLEAGRVYLEAADAVSFDLRLRWRFLLLGVLSLAENLEADVAPLLEQLKSRGARFDDPWSSSSVSEPTAPTEADVNRIAALTKRIWLGPHGGFLGAWPEVQQLADRLLAVGEELPSTLSLLVYCALRLWIAVNTDTLTISDPIDIEAEWKASDDAMARVGERLR
jgi:hypothetical protein